MQRPHAVQVNKVRSDPPDLFFYKTTPASCRRRVEKMDARFGIDPGVCQYVFVGTFGPKITIRSIHIDVIVLLQMLSEIHSGSDGPPRFVAGSIPIRKKQYSLFHQLYTIKRQKTVPLPSFQSSPGKHKYYLRPQAGCCKV